MEFLNLINAISSHVNAANIEIVCEMLEKLIVLGDQMEAAAAKAISDVVNPVQKMEAAAAKAISDVVNPVQKNQEAQQ